MLCKLVARIKHAGPDDLIYFKFINLVKGHVALLSSSQTSAN